MMQVYTLIIHRVLTAVSSFIIAFHCQVRGIKDRRTIFVGFNAKISSREYLIT